MIYELYQKPSYKWVAFDSNTSEQPIHVIEAPSYIIMFAIIIVSSQQIRYRNYIISDWVSWLLKPKLWTLFSSAVCTVLLCHKRLDQLIRPSRQDCLLAVIITALRAALLLTFSKRQWTSGSLVDIYASFRSNRRRSRASDRLRNARVVTLEKWGRIFAIKVIGNKDSFKIKFTNVWSKL